MSHRGSQRQAWPCGAGAPHLPPSAHWPRRGNPKRRGDKGRSRISSLSLPLSYGKVVGGGGCSSSREDDWINRFYEENRSWQGVPFRNSGRARAAPADPSSTPTLPRPPRSAATTGDPRSPRGALSLGRPALSHLSGQSGAKASGNRAASASVSKRLSSQDQPGGNIRSHRTDLPRQPPKDAAPLRRWRSTWHRDSAQSRKPSWPWAHLAFILSARKPAPRRTNLLLWSWQPYVSVGLPRGRAPVAMVTDWAA